MIISQTPLRISICGGGTDLKEYYELKEGVVVSTTINKYVYVIVKKRFDALIYIIYDEKEVVEGVNEIRHSLVREAARKAGLINGFEVVILSDVLSKGSGLGSSSSLTVGLLNAFYQYIGTQASPAQLAREACEIEIDINKEPIGKQDQYIAAYGGLSSIVFKKDGSVIVKPVTISIEQTKTLVSNLFLFYTNIERQSSSVLSEQASRVREKISYHDAIQALAYKALESLESGNINNIGYLLAENWSLKKQLASGISNNVIDEMYRRAITAGASGGKVSGAGGGGFLLLFCQRDYQDKLTLAMQNYREMVFDYEPDGSRIILDSRSKFIQR